jgi:hypothetical protein
MNRKETHEITRDGETYRWIVCHKCGGSRVFHCWGHIANGVCFACGGEGGHYKSIAAIEKAEKREAARAARGAKKAAAARAKAEARLAETLAARPGLSRVLELADAAQTDLRDCDELHQVVDSRDRNEIVRLCDFARKLLLNGSLTEKQADYALELTLPPLCERCNERGHRTGDCPTRGRLEAGRQEITGILAAKKLQEGYMGRSELKCLVVLDSGAKVWGSLPTFKVKLDDGRTDYERANRGARISFSAEVELKAGDPHFGFFKRPTKGRIVEQGPESDD